MKTSVTKKTVITTFVLGAVLTANAHAAVDTTAVMAELDQLPTYMAAVGGALIVAAATAIGYKWIKGAIFS